MSLRTAVRSVALALSLAQSGVAASAAGNLATVKVFAAASLTEAFPEIAAAFEKAHPGTKVELNLAGSQVLRTQIEQGARADVFASADRAHAEALQAASLLGPTAVFARNRVVVVVPKHDATIARLQDLAHPGMKIVVGGPTVPVGRYTTQVLARLNAGGLLGDDFQARVQANVVSQEANVRAVVAKVGLGEADAGFVYATDAAASADRVAVIDIPDRYNVVAEYPIGVVARSAAAEAAQAFVASVRSAEGQAILRKHGFAAGE